MTYYIYLYIYLNISIINLNVILFLVNPGTDRYKHEAPEQKSI